MSISTDVYTNGAAKVREVTEKSVESWRQGVKLFTDQGDRLYRWPTIDLTEPVARYFEFVQQAVDLSREVATRWAELVTSLSGSVREQAEKVGSIVTDQVDAVAELATTRARKAEELADEQAAQAEEAAREQEREIKRAERAAAKQAKVAAREPYEGLTKVQLSDQLAERGLPKTRNVEELIDRLVSADSE